MNTRRIAALLVAAVALLAVVGSAPTRAGDTAEAPPWAELRRTLLSAFQSEMEAELWLGRARRATTEAWASLSIVREKALREQANLGFDQAKGWWNQVTGTDAGFLWVAFGWTGELLFEGEHGSDIAENEELVSARTEVAARYLLDLLKEAAERRSRRASEREAATFPSMEALQKQYEAGRPK